MYKKVKSRRDKEVFTRIWCSVCDEFGLPDPHFFEAGIYYLFGDPDDFFGTTEVLPFNPVNGSNAEHFFVFSECPQVKECKGQIYEIGKLAVPKSRRGKHGDSVLEVMKIAAECAMERDIDYYVSAINPPVFEVLRDKFHLPMRVLGEPVHKEQPAVPVLIDTQDIFSAL